MIESHWVYLASRLSGWIKAVCFRYQQAIFTATRQYRVSWLPSMGRLSMLKPFVAHRVACYPVNAWAQGSKELSGDFRCCTTRK